MRQCGKRIHALAVKENVKLHKLGLPVIVDMIIERSITFGYRFQLIIEIYHDLAQRHVKRKLHPVTGYIFLFHQLTAFAKAKRHDRADEIRLRYDCGAYIRLLDMVDECCLRQAGRIMHLGLVALLVIYKIGNVRDSGYDIHVKLSSETFLNNLHMQESQETATETETESRRGFRLESQRSIVELQFLKRGAKILEILRLDRVYSGKHHRLHLFETGYGVRARTVDMSDRIAHLDLFRTLDTGDYISHVACREFLARRHVKFEHADLVGVIFLPCRHEFHEIAGPYSSVYYLVIGYDSPERIED